MFRRLASRYVAAIAMAVLVTTTGGEARAQHYGYAVVVIRNPTHGPVNYQVRWGQDGEWRAYSLGAGRYRYHYVPLSETGRAPAPYIVFDWVLGDGMYSPKQYRLGFYAAASPGYAQGKKYVFRPSPDGNYLDLYNS
jgi:hypothetical protein